MPFFCTKEINTIFASAIYRIPQMKQSLRIIPFLLGLFLFIEGFLSPASARTENTNKEVLVLNSINFNLPWAKNFYWCLHDALQKQGISVKAESLSVPALVNEILEFGISLV